MSLVSLIKNAMIPSDIARRVDAIELPWSTYGIDPYGVSKESLRSFFTLLRVLSTDYFSVHSHGIENIPERGRAMLIGNHSGGVAIDASIVIGTIFFDLPRPRLAQGMAEKFINKMPFASEWTSRTGQFPGLPEHAKRLLEEDRLLLVFPEGARGTAKLYVERHSLVKFGTGFMRLALETKTPIIPFACLGGGEALPTIANAYELGKLVGAPYIPITPYLLPVPLPVRWDVYFGAPMRFDGTGNEEDEVVQRHVDSVKDRIARMIEAGKSAVKERRDASGKESFR